LAYITTILKLTPVNIVLFFLNPLLLKGQDSQSRTHEEVNCWVVADGAMATVVLGKNTWIPTGLLEESLENGLTPF